VQGPELNPRYHQKNQKNNKITVLVQVRKCEYGLYSVIAELILTFLDVIMELWSFLEDSCEII
jgi:hypothetical protein